MAEPWDVFCTELMGCDVMPSCSPSSDGELHDAVSNLESQLQFVLSSEPEHLLSEDHDELQSPNSVDVVTSASADISHSPVPNDSLERPKVKYLTMIRDALLASDTPLAVTEIYQFVMDKYSFYRNNNRLHWKNSVRNNLNAYAGKLFEGKKPACEDGRESKCPIVWTMKENWKLWDDRISKNTTREFPTQKRKRTTLRSFKDGKKLNVCHKNREKATDTRRFLPPNSEELISALQSEPIDLSCTNGAGKQSQRLRKTRPRKRNLSAPLTRMSPCISTKTDTQSVSDVEPDDVCQLQPQSQSSLLPLTTTTTPTSDNQNLDVPRSEGSCEKISPTDQKFLFFDCQGDTCLGIQTPPSSVGSNNSSTCIEETSPEPLTPSADSEMTLGQLKSMSTEPVMTTMDSETTLRYLKSMSSEPVTTSVDSEMTLSQLKCTSTETTTTMLDSETTLGLLKSMSSEPVTTSLDSEITLGNLKSLMGTEPVTTSVDPEITLRQLKSMTTEPVTTSVDLEMKLGHLKSMSTEPVMTSVDSDTTLRQLKSLSTEPVTAMKSCLSPELELLIPSPESPTTCQVTQSLESLSSTVQVPSSAVKPCTLSTKPKSEQVISKNILSKLMTTSMKSVKKKRAKAPLKYKKSQKYCAVGTNMTSLSRPALRPAAVPGCAYASNVITSLRSPMTIIRPTITIFTPCLPRTPMGMSNLAPVAETRTRPYPVTQNLPEITVNDVCRTLQSDDWSVNLELHPGFGASIFQGFDYDAHCQRPLASERGLWNRLPDSNDYYELVQPDASCGLEESLATSLIDNDESLTLPADAIFPTGIMDDDLQTL